jgi:membrane associated rhomboid family serine protease
MTPVVGGSPLVVDSLGIAVAELPLQQLLLGAMILLSIGTLLLVSRSTARLTDPLTDRFIGGVPWGTLVVVSLLLAVYYGVQGGLDDPNDPVVLPFRAWSYFDPVGMLMAGFSHANFSHLTGNVIGTLAFGSVAEYWWGHYVDRRTETSWERLWTDPRVRAVLIFPVATILVGIGGTLVSIGPIIGFSTVVFAFAGFGLVRYPIQTVIASVGQGVLGRLFDALRMPQQVAAAEASYSTPWFANIAIQGHLVGLLLGVLLGLAVLRLRNESPPPALHVWTGLLLFAVSRALWAVYWFRGNETYVLYRALGLALVFALVAILTVSIVAPNRPLVPNWAVPDPKTVTESVGSTTGREVGLLLVLSVTAAVVGPAVPVNLTIADDAALPGEPIEIEGYEITYAENVPNGQLSVIPAAIGGETTQLNTSGVIVRNTDRHIWSTDTSTGELAAEGESTVRIGGIGWAETVRVDRTGWQAVGGQTAYQVALSHDNESRTVFASGSATAEPVVAGHRLSINATESTFLIAIEPVETTGNATDTNETQNATGESEPTNDSDTGNPIVLRNVSNESTTVDSASIPAPNESVMVGQIRFVNRDDRLFAVHRGTVVRIAQKE